MHTMSEFTTTVPAFLVKLWRLVEDPKIDDLICWAPNGDSFIIRNQAQFAKDILPHYYKHCNMPSFVRQLNMYGFHKKVSVGIGGLKSDKDEMEFYHHYFCKEHPSYVERIKRKIASNKSQIPTNPLKSELMSEMLMEVKSMKGRQEDLDTKLSTMKAENTALWRELAALRQKHMKQQQLVNKLIHFLVTIVQPSTRGGGIPVKRRYPLMINDSSRPSNKETKTKPQASPTGPVIHELDASESDLDSEYMVEMLENKSPAIHSPQEYIEASVDDENMGIFQLDDDSAQLEDDLDMMTSYEPDVKKKCLYKGKKKRKNKIPVRVLIPPSKNEGKSREQPYLLKMPANKEKPVNDTLLKNKSFGSIPVPMVTVPSSKLAAMAARIKPQEIDSDTDNDIPVDLENDMEISDNDMSMAKLENIFIVPEIRDESNDQNDAENREDRNNEIYKMNLNQTDGGKGVSMARSNEQRNKNGTSKSSKRKGSSNRASTSTVKDLSLSCVNSSGISDANYREEMGNHLVTVQSKLDNMRDVLYSGSCDIDTNTLLEIFDDAIPHGLSINPEMNSDFGKEKDDHSINSGLVGGELMAYNPAHNVLEFDENIFLGDTLLPTASSTISTDNLYANPLNLEDNKTLLFESLVTNDANPKL